MHPTQPSWIDAALPSLLRHACSAPGAPQLSITSPLTGARVATVPRATPADVEPALVRLRHAQRHWAATPLADRAQVLLRFHDILLRQQAQALDLVQLEAGKTRAQAFEELIDSALVARHYGVNAARYLAPKRRRGAFPVITRAWELRHPKGIVAIISPWNYPLSMGVTDALPALLAGNAVLAKPDLQTPVTLLWAIERLIEAGLPQDLMLALCGDGPELGPSIIAGADYLQFTGSTATGVVIAREAAVHLIGCSLELGGKNAMLVLPDANLAAAVDGAVRGCFPSAGQLCISIERLMVHESLYERFLAEFVERTKALVPCTAVGWQGDIGPLISARQLARAIEHVSDAVAKGATVRAGGRARPDILPFFFEPTILTGVTEQMTVCAEETFGPVVSVSSFQTIDEAVARANATSYGLNASVWSRDVGAARAIAARLQCGTVNINESYAAAWASVAGPMGGFKRSGLGRRHGWEGISKFTEGQTVAAQRFLPIGVPRGWAPQRFASLVTSALKLIRTLPGLR